MNTTPEPGTLEYCQAKLNEWKQQAEAAKKEHADLLDRIADLLDRIAELEGQKTDFINRGKRLDEAEQQLKDAVLLLTWPNTSADWRQRRDAFLASQKDAK